MNTIKKLWRALVCAAVHLSIGLAVLAGLGHSRDSVAGHIGRALPLVWGVIAVTGLAINVKED